MSVTWCSHELSSEAVSEAVAWSLGTWRSCTHRPPREEGPGPKEGPLSAELRQLAGGETGKQNLLCLSFKVVLLGFLLIRGVAAH